MVVAFSVSPTWYVLLLLMLRVMLPISIGFVCAGWTRSSGGSIILVLKPPNSRRVIFPNVRPFMTESNHTSLDVPPWVEFDSKSLCGAF